MLMLLCIRKVAIARVEALGQQEEAAKAISIVREFGRMVELILVPVRMVDPYMLYLVSAFAALGILEIPRSLT